MTDSTAATRHPNPYQRGCPSRLVLDRIADRWTVLVVGALEDGPLRYKEIAQRVDGISQKMLTQCLRGLERDGLATRTAYAQIPPKVTYELTETGRSLREPLSALTAWAIEHLPDVEAARDAYDGEHAQRPSS